MQSSRSCRIGQAQRPTDRTPTDQPTLHEARLAAVILASGALTAEERRAAFDAAPEMPRLMLNRAIAATFINPTFLDQMDALAGGFAREALAAHGDSTYLLVRAAGMISESKAAALFCARAQPDGWLDSIGPLSEEDDRRLRRSLVTVPLEACAIYVDAALNHAANAVVRFAYESGFNLAEVKSLGLDVEQPATERWTSWRPIVKALAGLDSRNAQVSKFQLAQALVACAENSDVLRVMEFRDRLIHRGVPVDLDTLAVKRATRISGGEVTLRFPAETVPEPQIEAAREAMARALLPCRMLGDAVHDFLPRWADHLGFLINIGNGGVRFEWTVQRSPVTMPASVLHVAGQDRITVPLHGKVSIRPRDQRDPKLFLA
jgi:hypothetical protein